MGAQVDAEGDGQPDYMAMGDDSAGVDYLYVTDYEGGDAFLDTGCVVASNGRIHQALLDTVVAAVSDASPNDVCLHVDDVHLAGDIEAMLPVPLHWRRQLLRGFNQATELCRLLTPVLIEVGEASATAA